MDRSDTEDSPRPGLFSRTTTWLLLLAALAAVNGTLKGIFHMRQANAMVAFIGDEPDDTKLDPQMRLGPQTVGELRRYYVQDAFIRAAIGFAPWVLMVGLFFWARKRARLAILAATFVVFAPIAFSLLTAPPDLSVIEIAIASFLLIGGHRAAAIETQPPSEVTEPEASD